MIVVHTIFPTDPEHRDEAADLMQELAEHSWAEEGVIDYRVAVDIHDPNLIHFTEECEDEAAFAARGESDHFGEFETALPDVLGGEPAVTQFDVESVTDLEL